MKTKYFLLRRVCKACGKEFRVKRRGRLCSPCLNIKQQKYLEEYYKKYPEKRRIRIYINDPDWAKKNPEKNRVKALKWYHKNKLQKKIKKRLALKSIKEKQKLRVMLNNKYSSH